MALVLVIGTSGTLQAEEVKWITNVNEAWTETQQKQRPLLVFFTTAQCRYCKQMLAQTFANDQVAAELNAHFVTVIVDANAEVQLARQLNVSVYPTTVIISSQAAVLHRLQGFANTKQLQDKLTDVKRVAQATGTTQK